MTRRVLVSMALALLPAAALLAAAPAAPASGLPAVGSPAPDFSLATNAGKQASLKNYLGKWVVLYFYPKDFTSGCTMEAHNFQRDLAKYEEAGAVILGVSVDSADSHKGFCAKEGLNFTLLADPDAKVTSEYGSVMEYKGAKLAERNTFLIDPQGKIAKVFTKVDPAGHSEEVLASIAALKKSAQPSSGAGKGSGAGGVTALALPGAEPGGVSLDYLAVDRARQRVWVPAGGTGSADVIDTRTQEIRRVASFPVAEVERNGKKRTVGPSSATVGDGVVYVGNRADSSVCAVDAATLERGGCATVASVPDGVAYVGRVREVWVTTPRDRSIVILDVSAPMSPKVAGRITLDGDPEGYAVDDAHGLFYTNLEDKDRTLRISIADRKVTATWMPDCGEDGPRGLALTGDGTYLMVACPDHVEALAASVDGRIVSKLETGAGVDNLDYLPAKRALYAAAATAATLTVATLDDEGGLHRLASSPTARGARNAVVTDEGVAYVASGLDGTIIVVRPAG